MFTPSTSILPLFISNNLKMLFAIVLFPEPVDPITPNDSPGFIWKDILSIPTNPVSG